MKTLLKILLLPVALIALVSALLVESVWGEESAKDILKSWWEFFNPLV